MSDSIYSGMALRDGIKLPEASGATSTFRDERARSLSRIRTSRGAFGPTRDVKTPRDP